MAEVSLNRRAGWIVGLWTLYGVVMAVHVYQRGVFWGYRHTWGKAFLAEMSFSYMWAVITPAVLWLGARFAMNRARWLRHGLLHLLAALLFTTVTKGIWDVSVLPVVRAEKVPTNILERWKMISPVLDYGILQYALILLCQSVWIYRGRYEQGRLRAAQLEAQLSAARLSALKMQLQPHFLFNTLHALSELVHEDPEAAERVIARLSDFLRLTLEQAGTAEITLAEELDFLKRYLEIEKVRFEDRLQIDFQVDPVTLDARVPNFILQPLVENALRHGLSGRVDDALLEVECSRDAGRLTMRVLDNGPGVAVPRSVKEGVGLANTRERLERLYGPDHRLDLRNVPSGGFEVSIEIPWKRSAP